QQQVVLLGHKLRLISHNLHPATLKYLGLSGALKALSSEFEREGLRVRLMLSEDNLHLDEQTQLCLFRIAQEALRNIVRHARSDHAAIRLEYREGCVVLTIRDRGVGFNVAQKRSGLGLTSMQERVSLVHGLFEMDSTPGSGTRIRVTVPISTERSYQR